MAIQALKKPEEYKSDFAREIEERSKNRPVSIFDVSGFFGAGDKPLPKIGIRTPTKREQDCAREEAKKYVAGLAHDPSEAKSDRDFLQDALAASVAHALCREVKPVDEANPDGEWKPTGLAVFPSPDWVCRYMEPERIAVLINLANEHRNRYAPSPIEIGAERIEATIALCDAHVEDDIPEAVLAGHPREYLTHMVVMLSAKLVASRKALLEATTPPAQPAEEHAAEDPPTE